jgi:hypothetical protein
MRFLRPPAALGALIAAEGVAVVAVHRLGDRAPFDLPFDHLAPWLRAAPGDALAAALRAVALLCAWYLLLITLAYACARAARIPSAIRACEWAAPCAIRRTVDRAVAASIVVGVVTTPFGARSVDRAADAPPPSVIIDVRDGRSLESLPADTALSPGQVSVSAPLDPPEAPIAQTADQGSSSVVAASGDNLWDLSAAALARATRRDRVTLSNDEIAAYWSAVCDANRATVRSGDVNLIYPGEVIVLPLVP